MPDLIKPVVDNDRRFTQWDINEVYFGPSSQTKGRNVPNVGDLILDTSGQMMVIRKVIAINETTLIPTTVEINVIPTGNDGNSLAFLTGVGPGYETETYRMYLDTSVSPHILAIDKRLKVYGSGGGYVKVFYGTDITHSGEVISQIVDPATGITSENLPLENVGLEGTTTTWSPAIAYTTRALEDNDKVTMVSYSAEGNVTSKNILLVHNTSIVRKTEQGRRYIKNISIESPFLSRTEDRLLQYPINLPKDALGLIGKVTYDDGSYSYMPVDGTRFTLHNLDNYISTKRSMRIKLVLTYKLSSREEALNASTAGDRHISVPYRAETTGVVGSYSVNLCVIPYWEATSGWNLNFYMYNLDRDIVYDVTQYIEYGNDSAPFNPKKFGSVQRIQVGLNLQSVDSTLSDYRHTQVFEIALMGTNTIVGTPFHISYFPGQDPQFGKDIKAVYSFNARGSRHELNVAFNATDADDWLERLYYRTEPVYNTLTEVKGMKPTHFNVYLEGKTTPIRINLSGWNNPVVLPSAVRVGSTIRIEFIAVEDSKTYYLASSPMLVRNS